LNQSLLARSRKTRVSELEFNVPFQHKHGYIRDERKERQEVFFFSYAQRKAKTKGQIESLVSHDGTLIKDAYAIFKKFSLSELHSFYYTRSHRTVFLPNFYWINMTLIRH